MTTWVTVAEAAAESDYTHEHITWLLRHKKVNGRKSASLWLVDLEDFQRYEQEMQEAGTKKHTPKG